MARVSETNYTRSAFALGGNETITREFTAAGDIDVKMGMVLGTISASGKLTICKSGSTDGSEKPVAIALQETSFTGGQTINLTAYNAGKFDESGVIFDGTDDFNTVVDGQTMRDLLIGNTKGIELIKIQNTSSFGGV
jgi:hypothetical protein